jgi:hypothetical protein
MASLSTASAEVASKPKNDKNTLALKRINDAWKGNSVSAATAAALDIGMLVAGCMVPYEKAKDNVLRGFEVRRVDEKWWSTVYEAFQSGRSSLATTADLHERFCSIPANDNTKDDTIDAWIAHYSMRFSRSLQINGPLDQPSGTQATIY